MSATTRGISTGAVAVTVPSGSPVAGSRACRSCRLPASLTVALIGRLWLFEPACSANLAQPLCELGLGVVGRVEARPLDGLRQQPLRAAMPRVVVRIVVVGLVLPWARAGSQP